MSDLANPTAKASTPPVAEPPRQVFGIGTVIANVFAIFVKRYPKVMFLSLPGTVLMGLVFYAGIIWVDDVGQGVFSGLPRWLVNPFTIFSVGIGCALGLSAGPLASAYDSYQRRGTVPVGHSLARVLARPAVALAVGILVAAAVILPLTTLIWAATPRIGLVIFCGALLVGMYALGLWGLALPAISMERIGFRGLKRSFRLSQGYRWPIACTCFVLFFAALLIGGLIGAGLIMLCRLILLDWLELSGFGFFGPNSDLFEILLFLDFCFAYANIVVLMMLGLAAIRARMVEIKEPPDIGDMVDVFD